MKCRCISYIQTSTAWKVQTANLKRKHLSSPSDRSNSASYWNGAASLQFIQSSSGCHTPQHGDKGRVLQYGHRQVMRTLSPLLRHVEPPEMSSHQQSEAEAASKRTADTKKTIPSPKRRLNHRVKENLVRFSGGIKGQWKVFDVRERGNLQFGVYRANASQCTRFRLIKNTSQSRFNVDLQGSIGFILTGMKVRHTAASAPANVLPVSCKTSTNGEEI